MHLLFKIVCYSSMVCHSFLFFYDDCVSVLEVISIKGFPKHLSQDSPYAESDTSLCDNFILITTKSFLYQFAVHGRLHWMPISSL